MNRNPRITLSLGLAIAAIALVLPTAARASTNVVPNPGLQPQALTWLHNAELHWKHLPRALRVIDLPPRSVGSCARWQRPPRSTTLRGPDVTCPVTGLPGHRHHIAQRELEADQR
jgi:hypothetical protein